MRVQSPQGIAGGRDQILTRPPGLLQPFRTSDENRNLKNLGLKWAEVFFFKG